jgi:hypothetical protein
MAPPFLRNSLRPELLLPNCFAFSKKVRRKRMEAGGERPLGLHLPQARNGPDPQGPEAEASLGMPRGFSPGSS